MQSPPVRAHSKHARICPAPEKENHPPGSHPPTPPERARPPHPATYPPSVPPAPTVGTTAQITASTTTAASLPAHFSNASAPLRENRNTPSPPSSRPDQNPSDYIPRVEKPAPHWDLRL